MILSRPNCNVTTDGRTSTPALEQHIPARVWHSNPVVEGAILVGYAKPPRYTWKQVEAEGRPLWYDVEVVVPPHANRPQ